MSFMSQQTCLEFLKAESIKRQKAEVTRATGNAVVSLQPVLIGFGIYVAVLVIIYIVLAFVTDPTVKAIINLIVLISVLAVQLWGIYIMVQPLFRSVLFSKNERFDDLIFTQETLTDLTQKLKLQIPEEDRRKTLATFKYKRRREDGAFDLLGFEKVSFYGVLLTPLLALPNLTKAVSEAFVNAPSVQPLIVGFNSYLPYVWVCFAVVYIFLLALKSAQHAMLLEEEALEQSLLP
jgi:hypothetical protein